MTLTQSERDARTLLPEIDSLTAHIRCLRAGLRELQKTLKCLEKEQSESPRTAHGPGRLQQLRAAIHSHQVAIKSHLARKRLLESRKSLYRQAVEQIPLGL